SKEFVNSKVGIRAESRRELRDNLRRLAPPDQTTQRVAEGEGFEPPEPFRVQWFSRPPPSTTRPSLRVEKLAQNSRGLPTRSRTRRQVSPHVQRTGRRRTTRDTPRKVHCSVRSWASRSSLMYLWKEEEVMMLSRRQTIRARGSS